MCECMSGMTDKQFKAFIRFILGALNDAIHETDTEKHHAKLLEISDQLRQILED